MLDLKFVRENFDMVVEKLSTRNEDISGLENFKEYDVKRRELITKVEVLKGERNEASQQVATLKREGKDAAELIEKTRLVGDKIKELDAELNDIEGKLQGIMMTLPNLPHESAPVGDSEDDNIPVRNWGEKPSFDFEAKPHWEVAEGLGMLDFETAGKVTGSRFVFYKGMGARLERALISYMLDLHTEEHGYMEVLPPYMVNSASLVGTGQLPKFEEDVFKIADSDYYLIPTAEVPVTNMHREEILTADMLPIKYAAYSACFRSEAGSAGRDTRGLIRQHQFNKVELVKFANPDNSYEELEKLTLDAEKVLQNLGLPYQVLSMCTADLGFTAAKKYDIEVWIPTQDMYREISSCSNFEDFQARRANIKFRREANAKAEFVHTLNGSGLAVGRCLAAILENYQQADGSLIIPEVLRPYMGGRERITK